MGHGHRINVNALRAGMAPCAIPIAMDLRIMVAPAIRAMNIVAIPPLYKNVEDVTTQIIQDLWVLVASANPVQIMSFPLSRLQPNAPAVPIGR